MGWFSSNAKEPPPPVPVGTIPILPVDLSKRYDVYVSEMNHDRFYENVRFVSIRTFDKINEYSSGLISGFLEIESLEGGRMFIPSFGIRLICEHGNEPQFKILRRRHGLGG